MKGTTEIVLEASKVQFTESGLTVIGFPYGVYRFPYRNMAYAYLCACDKPEEMYREPEIVELDKDVDGELVLYDSACCRYRIRTNRLGRTAGSLLIDLAMHAPYIVLGRQEWFDVSCERDFIEIRDMVDVRRQC